MSQRNTSSALTFSPGLACVSKSIQLTFAAVHEKIKISSPSWTSPPVKPDFLRHYRESYCFCASISKSENCQITKSNHKNRRQLLPAQTRRISRHLSMMAAKSGQVRPHAHDTRLRLIGRPAGPCICSSRPRTSHHLEIPASAHLLIHDPISLMFLSSGLCSEQIIMPASFVFANVLFRS